MKLKHLLFMLPVAFLLPWIALNNFSTDALLWVVWSVFCITSVDFTLRFYALDRDVAELQEGLRNLEFQHDSLRDMAEQHENTLTENLIFPKS